jgi:hypothetical protein
MIKKLYFVWLLSIAFLPFFQGGYFLFEAFAFGLVQVTILTLLCLKRDFIFRMKGFRFFYLIVIASALMSSFSAVDLGMHILGLLKLWVPFLFFLNYDCFNYHLSSEKIKVTDEVASVIIMTGTSMSITVILSVIFSTFNSPLVNYFVQQDRVGGFIQYANTFGIYLFATVIFAQKYVKSIRLKSVITLSLMCGIYLSQSRGTLIVVGIYLLAFILRSIDKPSRVQSLATLGATSIGFSLGQLILFRSSIGFNVTRGSVVDLTASEWLTRLLYYRDGIDMLIQNPLGYGYLGYYYSQRAFQSGSAYLVKFIHSSMLQMGLDYGILAMIAFGIFGFYEVVFSLWGTMRMNPLKHVKKPWNLLTPNFMFGFGFGLVFFHTWIDFDMEYLIIPLLLIASFVATEEDRLESETKLPIRQLGEKIYELTRKRLFFFLGIGMIVTYFYLGITTFFEYSGNSDKAYALYPQYTQAIDSLLDYGAQKNKKTESELALIAKIAIQRNPYFVNGVAFLAEYDYNNNKIETSLVYYKQLIQLAPLWFVYLENYGNVALIYCNELEKMNLLYTENIYLKDIRSLTAYMLRLKNEKESSLLIKNKLLFTPSKEIRYIEEKGNELAQKLNK